MTTDRTHIDRAVRQMGFETVGVTTTVLLVDDDTEFADRLAQYLRTEHGFVVETETDAADALDRLADGTAIDCVVSDDTLPGMDAIEFLDTVKTRRPDLPFVLFARQGSDRLAEQALGLGADEYLEKGASDTRYDRLALRIKDCVTIVRQRQQLQDTYAAIEHAGHGILITDTDGTITYANPTMEAMSGYDLSDLQGATPAVLKSGEHGEAFYRDLWETVLSGEVWEGEVTNERKSGEQYVIDQTISPLTEDGKITGFVAINREITERKERERDLQMFHEAVEEAGHAVVVTDTDGTIEYVNPAFEQLTGYDREEALGRSPAMLKSGEHGAPFYRDLWETILAGDVWEGELVNERKSGEQYVIDQTISPLTKDGEITGFVAINHDITELEEQKRELKRQNERLEQFGRTVAHDLRNPLNVVDANLSMARDSDDPDEALAKMRTSIDRMTELIDELLALAKHGTSVLEPEAVPLETVARTAWSHVDTGCMQLVTDSDTSLMIDDTRVCELFENLFRNAREHAGADATVRVGAVPGGFYVEDDGTGIPADRRDDVLTSGFTTSSEGTGFGLAIVSQIAEAHGWQVAVTTGTDGGARFEFHDVTHANPPSE